jgi:pyruvate/2-oxoglutarate dehydrogenase complex dihydrolipoamide acyltransferase (E2) component
MMRNERSSPKENRGYRSVPFTINRQMVAASTSVGREQSNIHAIIEVDISKPRQLIREIKEQTGESPSLTAYVITCLAKAVSEFPGFNSIRKGRNLIILDDVTIGVILEREINGEIVPENLGIRAAQSKTYQQIHAEIRAAQEHTGNNLGKLSGITWVRFIPGFLLNIFVKIASKNIHMLKRYGAVGVTAVGMFGNKNQALWLIPVVGGATVVVAVGGIVQRPCLNDGKLESHEHLCLTITFNHDIVDGAPAARFVKRFSELLMSGDLLVDEINNASSVTKGQEKVVDEIKN